MGNTDDRPDYDYTDSTLHLYHLSDHTETVVRLIATSGAVADRVSVTMEEGTPHLRSESGKEYQLCIH
jgi:hypothetical protein